MLWMLADLHIMSDIIALEYKLKKANVAVQTTLGIYY